MTTAANPIDWLEVAKVVATIVAPFLALGGAIFLFYAKNKSEHDQKLRKERQEIYLSYLEEVQSNDFDANSASKKARDLCDRCTKWHQKVQLIAPDAVVKASLRFINLHALIGVKAIGTDELPNALSVEERIAYNEFQKKCGDTRLELLTEMRRDILKNSHVSPDITNIENLEVENYWSLTVMRASADRES